MQLCWSKCLSLSVSQVTVLTSVTCTWSALSTTLCCVLSLSCFRTLWREEQGELGVAGYTQDCMRVPVFRETLNVQEVPAQRRMKVWSSSSLSSPSPLLFRFLSYSLLTCSLPCWVDIQPILGIYILVDCIEPALSTRLNLVSNPLSQRIKANNEPIELHTTAQSNTSQMIYHRGGQAWASNALLT